MKVCRGGSSRTETTTKLAVEIRICYVLKSVIIAPRSLRFHRHNLRAVKERNPTRLLWGKFPLGL